MSKRTDRHFLRDIKEAIHRIHAYTAGMTYDAFLDDTKTQDAVTRNLEITGEVTRNCRRACASSIRMCPGELWPGSEIG